MKLPAWLFSKLLCFSFSKVLLTHQLFISWTSKFPPNHSAPVDVHRLHLLFEGLSPGPLTCASLHGCLLPMSGSPAVPAGLLFLLTLGIHFHLLHSVLNYLFSPYQCLLLFGVLPVLVEQNLFSWEILNKVNLWDLACLKMSLFPLALRDWLMAWMAKNPWLEITFLQYFEHAAPLPFSFPCKRRQVWN